ncbi:MAG TPA: Wzz/FepE/Etk N-terminal domain-containing protein [Actinomycetota bacterium]
MEISDYLRVIWRRLWILVLVPLLAGGIVTSMVLREPPKYTATADVAAPSVVGGGSGQYSGPNGIKAFVANFTAMVVSPQVVNQVSKTTKVSVDQINSGLSSTPVGQSGLVDVTYTTTHKVSAGPVAKAAASATMTALFQGQVTLANSGLTAASKTLAAAQKKLTDFRTLHGLAIDPNTQFQQDQSQRATAENGRAQASAAAHSTTPFDQQIAALNADIAKLAPLLQPYTQLNNDVTAAQAAVQAATTTLQQASQVAQAASPTTTVSLNATKAASLLPELIKKAAPAVGAGLFLAVLIVMMVELVARRPRPPGDPRYASTNSHSRVTSSSTVYRG